MSFLIVRDQSGQQILTRMLETGEDDLYLDAWTNSESICFNDKCYKLHSVARTRPERNLILCVSYIGQAPQVSNDFCD